MEFLNAGLESTLRETTRQQTATIETAWLAPFPRVLLQDSTYLQTHEKMADAFKGNGGNASAAGVKVYYSYDVKSEKAEHIAIRQGADSDQGFAEDLAARVQQGGLVIRDLGYFCLNFFAYLTSIALFPGATISLLRAGQVDPAYQPFWQWRQDHGIQPVPWPEAAHPNQTDCLPAAIRRLPEAAKSGDQGLQTERPRHQLVVFEIPQVHVFYHQCPGRPVAHGGRRHSVPPSLASGAGFQKLEVAVSNQCPERHPPRTHSLPHLWTADRYPGSATLVGAGFRPSSSRAAGAVLLQS